MRKSMVSLRHTAKRLVKDTTAVQPGENLCVVTEFGKLRIARALADAGREAGAEAVVCVMERRRMHGNELPPTVASAMTKADVVMAATTYSFTHTDAFRDALRQGARILMLRSVTEESFTEGAITADYEAVDRLSRKFAGLLSEASAVHVTSALGTDLRMSLAGRSAIFLGGFAREPGSITTLPGGEAAISPVEGSAQGVLVVDHLIDGVGLLRDPVTVVVEDGRATDVKGGRQASRLRGLISAADQYATNVAEFAIGTNPKSRMVGNAAEDKVLLGCIHVAIGDNRTLGGTITSDLHLDMTVLNPTVAIDTRVVIRRGKLLEPA